MPPSTKDLFFLLQDAILAGLLISITCSALGVFTILKRVVFIGIALSEVAACGIALGMAFHIQPFIGSLTLTIIVVMVLSYPFESKRLPRDAILGFIFVFASALAVLVVSKSGFGLHEVKMLLYGDLILISGSELNQVLLTLIPVLIYFFGFFRPTLYTFLDREYAEILGIRVALWELLYFFALGLTISAASKAAGAILIFCFLVVSPSVGLLLSRRLGRVILISVSAGILSTLIGFYGSFRYDLPANQAISLCTCLCLGLAAAVRFARFVLFRRNFLQ